MGKHQYYKIPAEFRPAKLETSKGRSTIGENDPYNSINKIIRRNKIQQCA